MPTILLALLAIIAAYLLGSIPFAVVSSRLFGLADPRSYGSKNPGATNVLRSGNKAAAIVTLLGDLLKGWLAVYLAQRFGGRYGLDQGFVGFIALAVFFGHLYPVFLHFKGGKGVATAAGVLLAIDVRLGLATLATWLAIVLIFRISSLAALVAAAAAPMYAFFLWGNDIILLAIGVIAMALIGTHWPNLQRLMAGTEPKLGTKKPTVPVKAAQRKPKHGR